MIIGFLIERGHAVLGGHWDLATQICPRPAHRGVEELPDCLLRDVRRTTVPDPRKTYPSI